MLRYYASNSEVQLVDLQESGRGRGLSQTPAAQQPPWEDLDRLEEVRRELADLPALVPYDGINELRQRLAHVEAGHAHLLHVGECAELFSMANPDHVEQRVNLYQQMADHLAKRTGRDVVLVARMAGQHAKPRSSTHVTTADGGKILNYRGDAVNGIDLSTYGRQADPERLLLSYQRSRDTLAYMPRHQRPTFVSHEALLRDYEEPLTRGGVALNSGSAHMLWVGERTRNVWNWNVQWAALIANPVAVKIGPSASPVHVASLVHALNPWREQGRLSLITRMGAPELAAKLSSLLSAASHTGAPLLWQCDPMHGNTTVADGTKIRLLPDLRAEVSVFVRTLRQHGHHPAGLHLEVTSDDVNECGEVLADATDGSNPPCDPRLNGDQALEIVDHFASELLR